MFSGQQSIRFEFKSIGMHYLTLAHAQTNDHVSQFGHSNQVTADT